MLSGTEGERFIQHLCNESFFADYVFPNPQYFRGTKPKELCDALILFNNTAVLIEVKTASELRETSAPYEKVHDWASKKRSQSIKQLAGAIRAIQTGLIKHAKNSRRGTIRLDPRKTTEYYGIIILDHPFHGRIGPDLSAYGAPNTIVIECNFREFDLLCAELSTIGDFIKYLEFRKAIFGRVQFDRSGELDILSAFKTRYDLCERAIAETNTSIMVVNGQWDQYERSPWRKERQIAEKQSYIVDQIVQDLHKSFVVMPNQTADEAAIANIPTEDYLRFLDIIAQLPRFERVEIGKKLFEKSELHVKTNRPRYFSFWEPPLPLIVFVVADDREERRRWLGNLVHGAQVKMQADEAIGVALNSHRSTTGSTDWFYSKIPWRQLQEDDSDGTLKKIAELFRDAVFETRDEWDATSAGSLRSRQRETKPTKARVKRYKTRRKRHR